MSEARAGEGKRAGGATGVRRRDRRVRKERRLRPRPVLARWVRARLYATGVLLALLFAGVGFRAYRLQVVEGDRYRELAQRQHLMTVEIPAPRGAIFDRLGRELAVTASIESVFANPREVVDVASTAAALAGALEVDVRETEARLASRRHFVWIARHVGPDRAAEVRRLGLRGVGITDEPRRFYPNLSLAASILGFAGIDGDGLDGVELTMNDLLAGQRAKVPALRDAVGRTMLSEAEATPRAGASIALTLDRSIQHIAERALAEAVSEHGAAAGVLAVMDVRTGELLASAILPHFDPNDPGSAARRRARNRLVTDAYEIGSVMKVFTVAAALEAGVVTPDTVFDIEGGRTRAGRKIIRDSFRDDELTTAGILKRSSNVGVYKIARLLGKEALHDALVHYGFGKKTDVELPGERAGLVHSPKTWGETGLAAVSFGYNLTATPLQVLAAFAAVGNQGVYYEPRVVREVREPGGRVVYRRNAPGRRIMSEETAGALLPMLASVFDRGRRGGTARNLEVPGFRAGGKTGTAHKVDPETGRYTEERYLSSFIGLAPIEEPRVAVLVIIDEPQGELYYGADVAGPPFARVVSETLRYLGVPADERPDAEAVAGSAPARSAAPPGPAAAEPPFEPVAEPEEEPDPVGEDMVIVPDFRGLGIARALDLAAELGIRAKVEGSGRAVEQHPPPGPALPPVDCRLVFAPGG